jgi:hypothetical protein
MPASETSNLKTILMLVGVAIVVAVVVTVAQTLILGKSNTAGARDRVKRELTSPFNPVCSPFAAVVECRLDQSHFRRTFATHLLIGPTVQWAI